MVKVGKKIPTNSLVNTGRDPGNRHIGASLSKGQVAGEDYCGVQRLARQTRPVNGRRTWEGPVILAEIDDSDFVRDLGRWGGRIPSSVSPRVIRDTSGRLYQVKLYVYP